MCSFYFDAEVEAQRSGGHCNDHYNDFTDMYLNITLRVRLFRAYCLHGLKCTYGQSCDDGTTTTQDVQNYPGGWSFVVGG